MAKTITENDLNEIAQWVDELGGLLYAKMCDLHDVVRKLNDLVIMIENFRDRIEGSE